MSDVPVKAWSRPQLRDLTADDLGLTWHIHDDAQPAYHLYAGRLYIAEVYGCETVDGDAFRWVSKISDRRCVVETLAQARREVVADYYDYLTRYPDEIAARLAAAKA